MAQNITLLGASYSDVPAVQLPKTGGGTARFDDATVTTATATDVASGKIFLAANGAVTVGTASGGVDSGDVWQDANGYVHLSDEPGTNVLVTPLSVTSNGTYTAPSGTAYSPVMVSVAGGGLNIQSNKNVLPTNVQQTILPDKYYSFSANTQRSCTGIQTFSYNLYNNEPEVNTAKYLRLNGSLKIRDHYLSTDYGAEFIFEDTIIGPIADGTYSMSPYPTVHNNGFYNDGALQINYYHLTSNNTCNIQIICQGSDSQRDCYIWGENFVVDYTLGEEFVNYDALSQVTVAAADGVLIDQVALRTISGSISGNASVIMPQAFQSCIITEAAFSNCLSVGISAFQYCSSLTSVSFQECTVIGNNAFAYCENLLSVYFPNCKTIGQYAFGSCTRLGNVDFPEVTSIGTMAFCSCLGLTSVSFSKCTVISQSAFQRCSNLTFVNFPNCSSLGTYTFVSCIALKTALFPKGSVIGTNTFINLTNLSSIDFTSCKTIGASAFNGCTKLTEAIFPSCTYISNYAFSNCTSLTTISFPLCSYIGSYAFYSCAKLTKAIFPSCSMLANSAIFSSCVSLSEIDFPLCTSIGSAVFYKCSALQLVSFPKCSYVGITAFTSCINLSTIIFGAQVSSASYFAGSAFESCYRLLSVYLLAETMYGINSLISSTLFRSTPITGYNQYVDLQIGSIFVRESLYDTYKTDSYWSYFSGRFVSLTDAQVQNVITYGRHDP